MRRITKIFPLFALVLVGLLFSQCDLRGDSLYKERVEETLDGVASIGDKKEKPGLPPVSYTITPSAFPQEGGKISPSGEQATEVGKEQEFSASANGSYRFTGWTLSGGYEVKDDYSLEKSPIVVIAKSASATIQANFACIYTITPIASSGGSVSPSIAQTVIPDQQVTFTATPANGYRFKDWATNGLAFVSGNGTSATITVKLSGDANGTLTANFELIPVPTYTITPTTGNGGSVSPSVAQTVISGQQVMFTATPANGYRFKDWTTSGIAFVSGNGTSATITVKLSGDANGTLTANFELIPVPTYTITPTAGSGGSVSPSVAQTVISGEEVTFTATPSNGYVFSRWTPNGVVLVSGGVTSPTITVRLGGNANGTLTANFACIYTITPTAGTGGSVSPTGAQTVISGDEVTFTATPANGYRFKDWATSGLAFVSGNSTSATITVKLSGDANGTLTANFELIPAPTYTITPTAGSGGSVSPSVAQTGVEAGQMRTFTATANANYRFTGWTIGGGVQYAPGYNATTNPVVVLINASSPANGTLTANFVRTYTITPVAGTGGSVSPNVIQTVIPDQQVTFTATPANGYQFKDWTTNGVAVVSGGAASAAITVRLSGNANGTLTANFTSNNGNGDNQGNDNEMQLSANTATAEIRAAIANPGRGWYRLVETGNSIPNLSSYRNSGVTLVMVETDLGGYASKELDSVVLNQIRNALTAVRSAGLSAIYRAAYSFSDTDYRNNVLREPQSIDLVLRHIEQLKPIFAEYEDVLFSVQAGFLGVWGEWHTTRFGNGKDASPNIEHQRAVGNALLAAVPDSVTVSFRRPEYIRNIADTRVTGNVRGDHVPVTSAEAFGSSKIARSAFHNDALMSDESDMTTYSAPNYSRTAELEWINKHTRYVPMVGETNQPSEFNNTAAAIPLLNQINMQSLNCEYHETVLQKWKNTTYNGMNAYDYISMMLGYRFVLKSTRISQSVQQGATMRVELELVNDGFGHLLQEKKFEIVLKNGNQSYRAAVDEDARRWDKGVPIQRTYRFRLPADIPAGNWDVYLGLSSPFPSQSGNPAHAVRFSNDGIWDADLGLNRIGKITLTAGTSGSGGREFVQIFP